MYLYWFPQVSADWNYVPLEGYFDQFFCDPWSGVQIARSNSPITWWFETFQFKCWKVGQTQNDLRVIIFES